MGTTRPPQPRAAVLIALAAVAVLAAGAACGDDAGKAAVSQAPGDAGRTAAARPAGQVAKASASAASAASARRSAGAEAVVSTLAGGGGRGFADGAARAAVFNRPAALAVDVFGSVFVADEGNDLIRQITPDGVVTTFAGSGTRGFADGPRRIARFNAPAGIALDLAGAMYVADSGNDLIRKVTPDGAVSTVAGAGVRGFNNGPGRDAQFNTPTGLALDAAGNLYVADTGNDLIRKITPNGNVSTVAGTGVRGFTDGPVASAQFNRPTALAVDSAGAVYVADEGNDLIRKVTPDGMVSTVAGGERGYADGAGRVARFNAPTGLAIDGAGVLYIADSGNDGVRRMTPDGVVALFAGTGERGYADGLGRSAQFNGPHGVAIDPAGNVYVADLGNNLVRRVTFGSAVTVLAGSGARGFSNGPSRAAVFNRPIGIVVDGAGVAYVTDAGNDLIRKVTPDGNVTTFAGSGERGYADGGTADARFNAPAALALDSSGAFYVPTRATT
ncbi:MAG: NHL repeat-containing protein [Dehalococcoidia bacterium]